MEQRKGEPQVKAIELAKAYDPKDFEERLYRFWTEQGLFQPSPSAGGKPFVIVIPPPNVTGVLHMGHGLNNSLQDILIRYHRMLGEPTLWVPGSDHAGIATQAVVEAQLRKRGTSRLELGREKFIEETWKVKEKHHRTIVEQLQKIGCSCDWSRERFTLDEGLSRAVREVFVSLYERGLVYRGNYLINWCWHCGTAISDDEVEHEEIEGAMYHYRYPLADGSGSIEIATTRPETMLGDAAVAVHPDDPRYQALVGKTVELPLTGRTDPDRGRRLRGHAVRLRRGEGHPGARPQRLRDGQAARPAADQHPQPRRHPERQRAAGLPGPEGEAGPPEGHGGHQAGGAVHQGGEAPARGGALLPLPLDHRALPLGPVVRAHAAPGRQGPGRLAAGAGALLPEEVGEHLRPLAAQHPRLVHLPPAVVGAPHPGVVLRGLREDDRGPRGPLRLRPLRQRRNPPGPGRAGHLVLLGPVALLHPGLAGGHRRLEDASTPPRCWSPPTTSCSSGWPA